MRRWMRRRRIVWGFAANTYDRLLIAGVQLVTVPVLVLHWGLHLYGCWLVLASLPGFLALADLGFGGAAFVRMVGLVARGEREAAVVVLQTACQVVAIASALLFGMASLVIWVIPAGLLPHDPALTDTAARQTVLLLVLYTLAVFQGSLQSAAFASVQLFPLYAFTNAHLYLFEGTLFGIAVLTGHGPVIGAAGLAAGRALGVFGQAWLLRRRAPWLRYGFARASASERRLLGRSAVSMLAVPLGQALTLQGSVVALGVAAGPAATPAFAAARTLSRIGLQLTQLLTNALMPEFSAAHARGDRHGQAAMLCAVVAAACLVAIPFALVIGIAGDRAMALWTGGKLIPPAGLMPAVALSVVFGGLWLPLSSMMYAIDRQASFAWAYLLLGAGSVAATLWLGGRSGAPGAALAVAVLDASMCVVVGRFARAHWLRGLPTAAFARAVVARGRTAFLQLRQAKR